MWHVVAEWDGSLLAKAAKTILDSCIVHSPAMLANMCSLSSSSYITEAPSKFHPTRITISATDGKRCVTGVLVVTMFIVQLWLIEDMA